MDMNAGDKIRAKISARGLTLYDDLSCHPDLIFEISALEATLDAELIGLDLDMPIRTRAKVAKQAVAAALGYPVPPSFRKTQPRFPGQRLDVAVQKGNNFQVWNEDLDPLRRYALIRVDGDGIVMKVRVLTGEAIALLNTTGTLTSKYQAKRRPDSVGSKLVSPTDTNMFKTTLYPRSDLPATVLGELSPSERPRTGLVLPIATVYERLLELVGTEFEDPGLVQERNRGVELQKLVTNALGLGPYSDGGQFPDILSQVLEVKLQLSTTVDLGLVTPSSDAPIAEVDGTLRHSDSRYAIGYGERTESGLIKISSIVVSTGEDFFDEFQRFEGLVQNRKLQIPLPRTLFDPE